MMMIITTVVVVVVVVFTTAMIKFSNYCLKHILTVLIQNAPNKS
jgi:hypothetical protein